MPKAGQAASERFAGFLSANSRERLVIATHSRADTDGISAAFAISKKIPGSVIATAEEMNEGAKLLCQRCGIKTVDLGALRKSDYKGLVLVDTAAYTLIPQARGWKILCIIDHHRSDGKDINGEVEIIDETAPSAAEIVAGLLGDVGKDVAFALCVGIIADGARFKSARQNTFATLARLMEISGAEYPDLLSLAEPDPKQEMQIALLSAMKRVDFIYSAGYVIATSEVGSNESDAASLISEAADVAFVAKWKDETQETRISARARGSVAIPLNQVMGQVAKELGGAGGGHAKAAGAALKAHTKEALGKCVETFILFAENSRASKK